MTRTLWLKRVHSFLRLNPQGQVIRALPEEQSNTYIIKVVVDPEAGLFNLFNNVYWMLVIEIFQSPTLYIKLESICTYFCIGQSLCNVVDNFMTSRDPLTPERWNFVVNPVGSY